MFPLFPTTTRPPRLLTSFFVREKYHISAFIHDLGNSGILLAWHLLEAEVGAALHRALVHAVG